MPTFNCLGTDTPSLVLYLPHRPQGLDQLVNTPDAKLLMENNSNHWRKIVTLLAKVASPDEDWRRFRDSDLFQHTTLCFGEALVDRTTWHWIGGKDNLQRFNLDGLNAQPLPDARDIAIDRKKRILLTPYPDYRQISNTRVSQIRAALYSESFYTPV